MTEYSVRRSRRARRARIDVGPDGVEVVVPERFPLSRVEPFVAEKRPWIERTLRRYRRSAEVHPPARLEDGGELPCWASGWSCGCASSRAGSARTWPGGATSWRWRSAPRHDLRDELEAWLRRRARAEIEPRLEAATRRAGVRYRSLQIRGQRTRWASCSSSGAMSFNWRLLLAPPEILDYVVEHEVAHLSVHDHSQRFWRLLGSRCPDYRAHERWLRDHGHTLRL